MLAVLLQNGRAFSWNQVTKGVNKKGKDEEKNLRRSRTRQDLLVELSLSLERNKKKRNSIF